MTYKKAVEIISSLDKSGNAKNGYTDGDVIEALWTIDEMPIITAIKKDDLKNALRFILLRTSYIDSTDWISVKEQLPETNKAVLTYTKSYAREGDLITVGSYNSGAWFLQGIDGKLHFPCLQREVTHWKRLSKYQSESIKVESEVKNG